jgi:hypothetical protein
VEVQACGVSAGAGREERKILRQAIDRLVAVAVDRELI